MPKRIDVIDSAGKTIATAQVDEQDGGYCGQADLQALPSELRTLFAEWEVAVNDQLFGHLDEIEDRIAAHSFRVVFERFAPVTVHDLQIYPATGGISFRLNAPVTMAKTA